MNCLDITSFLYMKCYPFWKLDSKPNKDGVYDNWKPIENYQSNIECN